MASRPQPLRPVMLEPVASPVDTFVRHEKVEASPLWELANSLKGLERNLDGMMAQRQQEQSDADKAAGEAAFYQNNKTGYAEGVKQGLIPAFASPTFVQAYKSAEGNLLGVQLATKFKTAYDAWEGKNSSDPNAFDGFYTDFLKQNVPQSTDPAVLKGLIPHLRNLTQGGQAAFDQDRHKNMYNGSVKAHAALGKQALDQSTLEGIGSPKGFDADGLYGTLMNIRTESLKTLKQEDVDKSFVDNITSAAIERAKVNHADARKLLTLLDRTVPGQNRKWSDEPYAREQKQTVMGQLDTVWKQAQTEAEHKRKEADRKQLNDAQGAAIQWIISNPGKAIPDEILSKGSAVHGTFKVDAMGWAKAVSGDRASEDPEAIRQLYADIIAGGGQTSVRAALSQGVIRSGDTLKTAYDFADKVSGPNSPVARSKDTNGYKAARTLLQNELGNDKFSNPWGQPGMGVDASRALTDYEIAHDRYILDHPEIVADPNKLAAFQQQLAETVLKGAKTAPTVGDKYNRTPEVQGLIQGGQTPPAQGAPSPAAPPTPASPGAPVRTDGSAPPSPTSTPAPRPPAPAQPAFTPEQRQQYLGTRTPEQRQQLESAAAQRGVPVDQLVDGLLRRGGSQALAPQGPQSVTPDGSPIDPASLGQAALAALRSPAEFIRWMQSGEGAPPANQPSGFDAAKGSMGAIRSPADFIGWLTGQGQKALSPNPANAATTEQPTPNPFGDAIRAAFKANPALAKTGDAHTDRLLGFISNLEAPRGYNQMFGEKEPQNNLVGMTLDQVLALQDSKVAGGAKSAAAGRYQFMRTTLRDLKGELGLSGNERFNEQFQDQLAQALLERRGYSDWKAGRLSTEQFANNLAKEWAALPRVDTGRSHYDKDGINKALTTPGQVLATLGTPEAARSAVKPSPVGRFGPGDVYANIPEKDSLGEDQIKKFMEWNSDPVGNHETNLRSVKPQLQTVFEKARKDNPGLRIVVGAGVRSQADQEKAVKWGWSKTLDSHHADGSAMDIWVLDEKGRVTFDEGQLTQVGAALKKAAAELGVKVRWGGDFKSFKDRPHFELG